MFYRLLKRALSGPLYLPSYRHGKFVVGRRARSAPTRRMKAFADGGKFGTPVKKRSRRISTSNHGVTDRIALITTNTNLRTLSIAVAPNSPKVTVGNLGHQPKDTSKWQLNSYCFTNYFLPKGWKGARLRTPTPLVSSGQRRFSSGPPPTAR